MGQPENNGIIIAMMVPFVDQPCGHIMCGVLAAMQLGTDVPVDVRDVFDSEVIPALPSNVVPLFGEPRSV